ncbi:hypothetical protein EDD16DRAFT_1522309 [Pisolithus croceorrhizus]|nr:hypothetical protein EDD16DRAFT_1522309 [Pisolithus croceorrhizus]
MIWSEMAQLMDGPVQRMRLSEVGRQYHQFPKGTFRACFSPPALPKAMASHFAKNPPVWTWSIKAGPNEGKSFQVPTIPIACDKTAPRAVKWIVAVFHSFKAHLNPVAIDADSGWVHPAWLRLYQNNLLIHLRNQLKVRLPCQTKATSSPPSKPTAPTTIHTTPEMDSTHPHTPSPTLSPLLAEVAALCAELGSLKEKLYNYISTHEACCQHSNSPTPSSEEEAISDDGSSPDPQPSPSPPYQLLIWQADGTLVPDPNPPHWLTTVLLRIDLPTSYTGALYSPVQLINSLPRDASDVLKLHFCGSPPFCLAMKSAGTSAIWSEMVQLIDRPVQQMSQTDAVSWHNLWAGLSVIWSENGTTHGWASAMNEQQTSQAPCGWCMQLTDKIADYMQSQFWEEALTGQHALPDISIPLPLYWMEMEISSFGTFQMPYMIDIRRFTFIPETNMVFTQQNGGSTEGQPQAFKKLWMVDRHGIGVVAAERNVGRLREVPKNGIEGRTMLEEFNLSA